MTNPFLETDLYKFSMALAGRPDERETFYLSYRKGGPLFVPTRLDSLTHALRPPYDPRLAKEAEGYLETALGCAWRLKSDLFHGPLTFDYVAPVGSWVYPREPILTISGPSLLVSWLEPKLIGAVSFLLQAGTFAANEPDREVVRRRLALATCWEQEKLVDEALCGVGVSPGRYASADSAQGQYFDAIEARALALLRETHVEPHRIFEVGLRGVCCTEQHKIALEALRDAGIRQTSHVAAASALGLKAVGTMGHEGVMRWENDDTEAFYQHRQVLPRVTYLLDTNDTTRIGIPAAAAAILANPERGDGGRPDSGDLEAQFRLWANTFQGISAKPPWVFEDGLTPNRVVHMEGIRKDVGYPADMVFYGLGGYLVGPDPIGFVRSEIEMVYKLSETKKFGPVMKFADEPEDGWRGKSSLPGRPVVLVDRAGRRLVAQVGESVAGYHPVVRSEPCTTHAHRPALSNATQDLIDTLAAARQAKLRAAGVTA